MVEEKKCKNCNKILPKYHDKFCCRKCTTTYSWKENHQHMINSLEKNKKIKESICPYCQKTFIKKNKKQIYCSRRCFGLINSNRVDKKFRNIIIKPRICLICGEEFRKRTTGYSCCSRKCLSQHSWNLKKEQINKTGIIVSLSGGEDRNQAKKYLIEKHGHKCMGCGISEYYHFVNHSMEPVPLILDHIDGYASNNHIGNLRLLCPICDHNSPTFGSKNFGRGRKALGLKLN